MKTTPLAVDATNRARRSFVQGLFIDVLVAIAAALLVWLPGADLSSRDAWVLIGITLAKTVLQTAASYVMRRFVDTSTIPTPLPPTPQPAPAEPNKD
jgi:hypothetical protein